MVHLCPEMHIIRRLLNFDKRHQVSLMFGITILLLWGEVLTLLLSVFLIRSDGEVDSRKLSGHFVMIIGIGMHF